MSTRKEYKEIKGFSLNTVTKPRFSTVQIHVENSMQKGKVIMLKPTKKLKVGRTGKIEYSE